ncbi:MAG: DUF72 domain-containing protein [Anaerolineales bacterium]|nr:MAG: DUF72 domain-containing protein [Anaerolineales bacterium]
MIRMGTSGFSYDDWVGTVYPEQLPRWSWLGYYAQQFDTVELNVTYYRIPEQKIVQGWIHKTPDDFLFTVKAHRSLTHEREHPQFDEFRDAVLPLRESGRLASILAQFPHSFHPDPQNREYLAVLREGLQDLPVVIEFRDTQWVGEETFSMLEKLQFGFCCVDEPQLPGLMPPVFRATSDIAYIRFHGRNGEKWYQHDHAWERYDYSYTKDDLLDWIPRIKALDAANPLTLVYANNHYRGQSVETLRKLEKMLVGEEI